VLKLVVLSWASLSHYWLMYQEQPSQQWCCGRSHLFSFLNARIFTRQVRSPWCSRVCRGMRCKPYAGLAGVCPSGGQKCRDPPPSFIRVGWTVWLYDAGVCFLQHWLAAGVTLHMGWGWLFVQQVHCMCGLHSCGWVLWWSVVRCCWHQGAFHVTCSTCSAQYHYLVCALHGGVGCAGLLCGILMVDSSSSRVALLGGTTRELCVSTPCSVRVLVPAISGCIFEAGLWWGTCRVCTLAALAPFWAFA
jgi:hypothetical protein